MRRHQQPTTAFVVRLIAVLSLLLLQQCSLVLVESTLLSSLPEIVSIRGGSSSSSPPKGSASTNSSTKESKPKKKRKPSPHNNNNNSSNNKSSSSSKASSSSPVVEEILQEEDYYKILGISRDEVKTSKHPDRVVQKAYRKRAVHTHPDKTGGDRRAFDKVAEAYEVLQDQDKRTLYDRYGKEGMKQQLPNFGGGGGSGSSSTNASGGMSAEDLFRSFFGAAGFGGTTGFGGGGGFGGRTQRVRQYILEVSLEDLYMGTTKTVQLPESGGETITCQIPRGMRDGTALQVSTNHGETVQFIVRPRQHHLFIKQGFDLILSLRITLTEAITGVQRQIKLLDGSTLCVASAGNEEGDDHNDTPALIETGDVHVLKGYGMPKGEGLLSEKGNLYIQYEVVRAKRKRGSHSSTTLSPEEMVQLKTLLAKLEGRLFNDLDKSSTSTWPFTNNKDHQKKVKRLQKASPEDILPKSRSNPFETGGFSFGAGFSSFGNGGSFFTTGGF